HKKHKSERKKHKKDFITGFFCASCALVFLSRFIGRVPHDVTCGLMAGRGTNCPCRTVTRSKLTLARPQANTIASSARSFRVMNKCYRRSPGGYPKLFRPMDR